jgi:hypothetical protein
MAADAGRLRTMLDRSRVPHALSLAVLSLLLLVLPAAARAQDEDRQTPVPAGAPTALTAADGSALILFASGSSLCFALQKPGEARPTAVSTTGFSAGGGATGGCGDLPVLTPFAAQEQATLEIGDAPTELLITGTGVAAVEAKRAGQVVAHAVAAPTGLPGAGAELRVALVPLPPARTAAGTADELALLDAMGVVRTAIAPDVSFLDDPEGVPTQTRTRTLARGRRGGQAWRLGTYRKVVLAPTPLLPERHVTVSCLIVTAVERRAPRCDEEAVAGLPVLGYPGQACSPLGRYTTVLARAAVRRVVLVLGDGSRRAIPLRAVPGDPDGLRAGVAFVGEGVAIRRLIALGAHGTLQSDPLRLAPVATPRCSRTSGGPGGLGETSIITYSRTVDHALQRPGPHVFHAADSGPDLCLAVDRTPHPRGGDCAIPPADIANTFLPTVSGTGVATVAGLVPADVALARLTLDDGSTRDVPATPIPGYAGQYATTTLLVYAQIAAPRQPAGYQLLDARGRVLQKDLLAGPPPVLSHTTTVLRTPGLPPLRAGLVTGLGPGASLPCLALGALDDVFDCTASGGGNVVVRAFCAPRRVVLWSVLSHASDDLVVQMSDGREITARKAVLPAAIRRGRGTTAALLVLPAGVGTRRVIVRGKAAGKTDLVLPPAAGQCGYDSFAWPTSGLVTG